MMKFKKLKKSLSIVVKFVIVVLLVVGIYEINEMGFFGKFGGIMKVLNLSFLDIL